MNKKIAICMSTFNGIKYIEQQISSILTQSFANFTLYIRDDGSTDGTIEYLNTIVSSDSRIKIIENISNDNGAAGSFIQMIKYIDSDYYFFCDQDDVWLNQKIELTLNAFSKLQPGPALIHTDLIIVDDKLENISESFYVFQSLDPYLAHKKERLIIQNYVVGCTSCFNKELVDILNLNVIPIESIAMHDWWFALTARFFGELYYLDIPTIKYRQHSSNVLGASDNSLGRYLNSLFSGNGLVRVNRFRNIVYLQARSFFNLNYSKLSEHDKKLFISLEKIQLGSNVFKLFSLMFVDGIRLQGNKRNLALFYSAIFNAHD
ncbi:glycosyltransferase family 2 protein [Shewanella profunda]|uniref:glycosyltransferase family 2 protein n=1 Tax=Shewanella profunda TaxID=254793 RepID=UPI00200C2C7F|nr:glycosyltransferase family 2 protein [Shewanella profunda]MCL1090123.1 glycosyltransferase family 2 protein [Shewanella profunda]